MTKKKTIISDALADYTAIQEAAQIRAKDELAKELPSRFNKLYNAKVKESLKESFEDEIEEPLDGIEIGDEAGVTPEEIDATEFSLEDIEKVFNNASETDEFDIQPKEDEEIRLSFDEIASELAALDDEEEGDDTQEIDGEVDMQPDGTELNNNDTMDGQGEKSFETTELNELIAEILSDDEYYGDDEDDEIEIKDAEADRALNNAMKDRRGRDAANNDLSINEVDGEVDENMIRTLSQKKTVGGGFPRSNDDPKQRYGIQESKKVKGYIQENQKLMIELAESKSAIAKYNDVLKKYRVQLSEMAVFNTNLSYANNLLVNESLSLTSNDKANIVNEFKALKTIDESKEKYTKLLEGFGAKRGTSGLEDKLSKSSIQIPQKQLNEVVEKTVYQKDEHLTKIKRLF